MADVADDERIIIMMIVQNSEHQVPVENAKLPLRPLALAMVYENTNTNANATDTNTNAVTI